jgi:PRTRC genetic system ThiF family protein
MRHVIDPKLLTSRVRMVLVGCGGTGSQVLTGLARLHIAMKARGHPHGLAVSVWDPDVVTEANVGRQLYAACDLGQNKAEVLVDRLNMFYGVGWEAVPRKFNSRSGTVCEFIISCVDTRRARKGINAWLKNGFSGSYTNKFTYLLDCGNMASTGQVLLGQRPQGTKAERETQLPLPYVLFPDLVDTSLPEDDVPSCSLAEALGSQSLFINQMVATHALQLLTDLFFEGGLDVHGVFFNLKTHKSNPLPVDPEAWKRIMKTS